MKATLSRLSHEEKQTLGIFTLYDGVEEIFGAAALELPDRNNRRSVSRICPGTYKCVRRWSEKYGWHYHILDVEGRSLILIHFGNYHTDTRGCILLGNAFVDLDKDGSRDVTSSRKTMKRLLNLEITEFELTIIDL